MLPNSPVDRAITLEAGSGIHLAPFPELDRIVTVEAIDCPLVDLLAQLSIENKVDLRLADHTIREQRITVLAKSIKLSQVMGNLILILSHGKALPDHPLYFWKQAGIASAGHKTLRYDLNATYLAAIALQKELDRPRHDALQFLKDMRDEINLPLGKRLTHPHVMRDGFLQAIDLDPDSAAVAGLSNSDLEQLIDGKHLLIHSDRMNDAMKHSYEASVDYAQHRGDKRNFPPFQPETDDLYTVAVSDSFFADDPTHNQAFMIDVSSGNFMGYATGGIHIGGLSYDLSRGVGLLPTDDNKTALSYDLDPLLQRSGVTDTQRRDAGFNIAAIAKVAHINVLAEQFLRPPRSPNGLHKTKGTLPELMNDLCVVWNLWVTKSGDSYIFWDRDWGRMRQADISDPELGKLRKTDRAAGRKTFGA